MHRMNDWFPFHTCNYWLEIRKFWGWAIWMYGGCSIDVKKELSVNVVNEAGSSSLEWNEVEWTIIIKKNGINV